MNKRACTIANFKKLLIKFLVSILQKAIRGDFWGHLKGFYKKLGIVQGVPTSFRWEVLVKISNLREIRILKFFVKKKSSNWNEICTA